MSGFALSLELLDRVARRFGALGEPAPLRTPGEG